MRPYFLVYSAINYEAKEIWMRVFSQTHIHAHGLAEDIQWSYCDHLEQEEGKGTFS